MIFENWGKLRSELLFHLDVVQPNTLSLSQPMSLKEFYPGLRVRIQTHLGKLGLHLTRMDQIDMFLSRVFFEAMAAEEVLYTSFPAGY